MSSCCFIVEIVIRNIELTRPHIENACDLKISVQNNNFSFTIYSDHESLADFRAGQSYEFDGFPELLKLEMQIFPIALTIFYKDAEIGSSEFKWPENIIDNIDEDMRDMIHKQLVMLSDSDGYVGCLDLILRLRVKNKFEIKEHIDLKKEVSETMIYYTKDDELLCEIDQKNSDSSFKTFKTPSIFSGCHQFDDKLEQNIGEQKTLPKSKNSPSLSETSISLPRYCPVCKTDLSWMPKSVPCPKCNYLVEDIKSTKYNDELTAEQILKMYAMSCNDTSSHTGIGLTDEDNTHEKSAKQVTQSMPNLVMNQTKEEVAKPLKKLQKRIKRVKRFRIQAQTNKHCDPHTKFPMPDPRVTTYIQSLLPNKPKRHAVCARVASRVPPHMGWLWTAFAKGTNEKWRPGAIRRPIKEIMSWFLKDFPVDTIPVSRYAFWRNKQHNEKPICTVPREQTPVLHILKKKGEYTVTMRPLKKKCELLESVDPFSNTKPLRFRIRKNPTSIFVHDLKVKLKDLGYTPCVCHQPIKDCICHSFKEKKQINDLVEYECRKNKMPAGNDTFVMSDVTESESELDFGIAPPVSRMKQYNLHKPDFIHVGTQYSFDDWCLKPKFSIFGQRSELRKPRLDVNKYNKCAQNIQPPIIVPINEKPVKKSKKRVREKKKLRKSRGRRK